MKQSKLQLNFDNYFFKTPDRTLYVNNFPLDCLSLLYNSIIKPLVVIVDDLDFELSVKYLGSLNNNTSIALIPPDKDIFNEPKYLTASKNKFINKAKEVFASGVQSVPFVLSASSGITLPLIGSKTLDGLILSRNLDFNACVNFLKKNEYVFSDITLSGGDYSLRGGIIDFFPRTRENPLRLSFLEDHLVVHSFDIDSQLTTGLIKEEITIPTIKNKTLAPINNFIHNHYLSIYLNAKVNSNAVVFLDFSEILTVVNFSDFKKGPFKKILPETSLSSTCLLNKDGFLFVPPEFINKNFSPIPNHNNSSHKQLNVSTIQKGDFLVHRTYGVGRFLGLGCSDGEKTLHEYILIQYGAGEIVKIDVHKLDLVDFFANKNSENIIMDSLSKKNIWKRKYSAAQKAANETVKTLLNLYVKRSNIKRTPLPEQGKIEQDFLEDFPFTETEDQKIAWNEISKDMSLKSPMDRLLCGDVGFGKTEIAMRAAFRCVLGNKRVVVLAPTTLLTNQLYLSFKNRLSSHGVIVELLSRFKSKKDIISIKNNILNKNNDILIGTHSLLSDNVFADNLGLLIIDEEHRFGVSQKEKIKQHKNNIDVLSMSATPIPRSMNLAISGIYSISLLQTPPLFRRPIITSIKTFNDKSILDAISFEVLRGGQVFFVNNDIQSISAAAGRLKKNLPLLNIKILHGQEPSKIIEKNMNDFISKKINVLVCTSIIEAGIDVPNANCIIINNAHLFGLAQLYQMRGRVGRSNRQAYAYLLLPYKYVPSKKALSRLKSIKKNSKLGSGHNISQSDLEIRGGGSLFGYKQSGGGSSVGYEMYIKLIKRALHSSNSLKTNFKILPEDVQINIYPSARISSEYITSDSLRFSTYKDCVLADSEKKLDSLLNNIINRFGPPSTSFLDLINECKLKLLASEAGFSSIVNKGCGLVLETMFINKDAYFSALFNFINGFFLKQRLSFHFLPKTKKSLSLCIHFDSNEDKYSLLSVFLNKFKRLH